MPLPWGGIREAKDITGDSAVNERQPQSPLEAFKTFLSATTVASSFVGKKVVGEVFKAGARIPRAALSAAEAHQKFKQVPAEEFYQNPEEHTKNWLDAIWGGAKEGFAPDIFTPEEEVRNPNEIAWDMADRVYGSKSESVAWEFVKNLPFTTLGTMTSIRLNPAIFLAFKGVDNVIKNLPPKMKEFVFKQRKLWKKKPLKDAYKELGLKPNASFAEVQRAYHAKSMRYHPHRPEGKTVEGVSKFVNAQAAFEKIKSATYLTEKGGLTPQKQLTAPKGAQPAVAKPLAPVTQQAPGKPVIPKGSLTTQAKQFKTAEEFVEAQNKFPVQKNEYLFHASDKDLSELSEGTYFGNLQEAKDFLKTKKGKFVYVVKKSDIQPTQAKEINEEIDPFGKAWVEQGIAVKAKNKIIPIAKLEADTAFKVDKQLTDIWKRAQGQPITPAFTEPVVGSTVTKAIIHKATGFKTLVETVTAKESTLLTSQLRTLSRGGKVGIQVGKELQRKQSKVKQDIVTTIKSLLNLKKAKVPKEFKEVVEEQLDDLGLGKGTRPLRAKSKMLQFIEEQEAAGELLPISKDDLTTASLTNLGNATLDLLQNKLDVLKQLVHYGRTQQFLIAEREQQNVQTVVDNITKSIYGNSKKAPSEIRDLPKTPSERQKTILQKVSDAADSIFAEHQKVEFLAIRLDGFQRGIFHETIVNRIQRGANVDLKLMEEDMNSFNKAIRAFPKKELNRFFSKQFSVARRKMTPNEMVGVYVNSFAPGNIRRLKLDNKFTDEDISVVKQMVTKNLNWKRLADKMMDIAGNKFSQYSVIQEKITGKTAPKIDRYWPIVGDRELDPAARMKGKDIDLFKDAIKKMTPEAGFAIQRQASARGAIDLDATKVFMNHIKKVNHYIAQALPVRDVRKILSKPEVQKAMIDVLGEHSFAQFPSWLQAVANPRAFSITGDSFDKWAGWLKRNATAAILGLKVSVSLLQAGSYSQTVNEIGEKWAALGAAEFAANPIKAVNFMHKMSIQQRYRSQHLDRDIKEFMESTSVQNLIKGKLGSPALFFAMIRGVDLMTVAPTWLGAYHKGMSIYNGNETKAEDYADSVVRVTQPAGAVKDLAAVSRGSNFKKLWTMFYTHFSNYQNNMANAFAELRTGRDNPFLKTAKAARSFWWLLVWPAMYAGWVRSGGKAQPKDYVKSVATYSISGIIGLRDLANIIAFGRPQALTSPGLSGAKTISELVLALPKGDIKKIFKHGVKSAGFATGLPTEQGWITAEGIMDMLAGETSDIRRLFYSKYALKEDGSSGIDNSIGSSGGNLPW